MQCEIREKKELNKLQRKTTPLLKQKELQALNPGSTALASAKGVAQVVNDSLNDKAEDALVNDLKELGLQDDELEARPRRFLAALGDAADGVEGVQD